MPACRILLDEIGIQEFVILKCTNASGKQGVLFCPQLTGGYYLVYVSICNYFLGEGFHGKEDGMNIKLKFAAFLILTFILSGCARNLPTPPEQITGFYTSGFQYEQYSCQRLLIELNSLVRLERVMVKAQKQRIINSEVIFSDTGYGLGDGFEAYELSNARGEKSAVLNAMEAKGCQGGVGLGGVAGGMGIGAAPGPK